MKSVRRRECEEFIPSKRRRLDDSEQPQSSKVCTEHWEKPTVGLLDLPTEILEKIIGYVNIYHHRNIRRVSRRLRDISNSYIRHEFYKALKVHTRKDAKSVASVALRSMLRATEVYVKCGFEASFWASLLPWFHACFHGSFVPNIFRMRKFLLRFYYVIDGINGINNMQQKRLCFHVTLIRLLKDFTNACVVFYDTNMVDYLRVAVEIQGAWLGVLWATRNRLQNRLKRCMALLIMVTELYALNKANENFKRLWEYKNEIYIYGSTCNEGLRIPRTIFKFKIYGTTRICSLFRLIFEQSVDNFELPTVWTDDEFTINLEIDCRMAAKWGCSRYIELCFGPLHEYYR